MSQPGKSIFIVDDDESIRNSLRRLFLSAGYMAETFSTGTGFLDSVPMESQGTVIMDIHMPGMDGLQVQNRLREFRSPLKIIFITGHAKPGDREKAMANGAYGFLMKPFDDQSLLSLIHKSQTATQDNEKKPGNTLL
ncbi:MAG: Response regulator protein TmoT [Elusimicrobia bacterium]|nr:Response regulator protein TmoT [Elusimicrobiota bacterium]